MDRADQSVTRHAAASRAAYETLYAAFASQPQGIKESHKGVLDSLRNELRLDQSFAREVAARHDIPSKRTRGAAAAAGGGISGAGGIAGGGGDGEKKTDVPAIQIAWKEVGCFFIADFVSQKLLSPCPLRY